MQLFILLTAFLWPLCSALHRIVVVGGGAAGIFSAIECGNALKSQGIKAETIVLEATKSVLSKVLISGGGRCNVMHDPYKGVSIIAKGYPRGNRELLGPFNARFSPMMTMKWFKQHGLELKVEVDGRMFPTTDKSTSVIEVLRKAADEANIQILNDCKVSNITYSRPDQDSINPYLVFFSSKLPLAKQYHDIKTTHEEETDNSQFSLPCSKVILTTGSSRIGYSIVKKLGHTLSNPLPSLFSFQIKEADLTSLTGISVDCGKVKLTIPKEYKLRDYASSSSPSDLQLSLTQRGPILITKQGLSGPAVLKLSAFGAKLLAAMNYRFQIEVSWVGELDIPTVQELLEREKRRYPQRNVGKGFPGLDRDHLAMLTGEDPAYEDTYNLNSFEDYEQSIDTEDDSNSVVGEEFVIKRRLWLYILQRANITTETKWSAIKQTQLTQIAQETCRSTFTVTGRGLYKDEFVTCGGVPLKEVAMDRMESKKVPGLYFAGEVLDVDGITGGYNFQSAWTTGFIAGHECAKSLMAQTNNDSEVVAS